MEKIQWAPQTNELVRYLIIPTLDSIAQKSNRHFYRTGQIKWDRGIKISSNYSWQWLNTTLLLRLPYYSEQYYTML